MLNYKSFLAYRALAHSSPHEILLRILESRRNLGLNFRENSAVGGVDSVTGRRYWPGNGEARTGTQDRATL